MSDRIVKNKLEHMTELTFIKLVNIYSKRVKNSRHFLIY
jgi:hypothetical protein